MAEQKTNGINVFFGKEHININAEVIFGVKDNPIHLANALDQVLLSQLRQHDNIGVEPGAYRLSLTLTASRTENAKDDPAPELEEENEVSESND